MATTAPQLMKGPKPTKTGINAKIDYVHSLAGTGITRDDAIQKLLKKFPKTKPSYARSIVYSRCAGLDFVRVRRPSNRVPIEEEAPRKKAKTLAPKLPAANKRPVKKARPRPSVSSPDSSDPVVFNE